MCASRTSKYMIDSNDINNNNNWRTNEVMWTSEQVTNQIDDMCIRMLKVEWSDSIVQPRCDTKNAQLDEWSIVQSQCSSSRLCAVNTSSSTCVFNRRGHRLCIVCGVFVDRYQSVFGCSFEPLQLSRGKREQENRMWVSMLFCFNLDL